jgi:hypothetical protein
VSGWVVTGMPFKLPHKKAARSVANADYWRLLEARVQRSLELPEVRRAFRALGLKVRRR